MRYSYSLILAVLAGCGSGAASPDARVIDSGGIDALPGAPTVVATSPADGDTARKIQPTGRDHALGRAAAGVQF